MPARPRSALVAACVLASSLASVRAATDASCYTSGSVAGIVIATIVVTLVLGGLAAAFVWYLWKKRKDEFGDTKSLEKPMVFPPMCPEKQKLSDYAFDNPYFKDDEANPGAAEKGESGFRADNGGITTSQNVKASNGTPGKKSRPFSSLPFHNVFHPAGKKHHLPPRATAMDDTYIAQHAERVQVQLKGQDFAGLGFNICGNMRDGIFVKDVLHRGPASESGQIKAGDRIVGVTVSFGAMVYEDALTILSYASPYDIQLEVEKAPAAPASPTRRLLGASTSFRGSQAGRRRLFHPLYRSQSMDDLTQIGKEGSLGSASASGSQRESTPKRSQSVEVSNGGPKARPALLIRSEESKSSCSSGKGSRKSSVSSCGSAAKAATPTEVSPASVPEEATCSKRDVKSARYRAEQVNVKAEATRDAVEKTEAVNGAPERVAELEGKKSAPEAVPTPEPVANGIEASGYQDRPTVPPRTPKRKAPAPPPVQNGTTRTSAIVHREDSAHQNSKVQKQPPANPINGHPSPASDLSPSTLDKPTETALVFSSGVGDDPGIGSSDASSLSSADHHNPHQPDDQSSSSPGKRKASSLGDLTTLDKAGSNKSSTSSAILERAVSLDLQQSLPEANLTKQKKTLHAPTFEDEDEEDCEGLIDKGLKRWENGLDEVFSKLTNGIDDDSEKSPDRILGAPASEAAISPMESSPIRIEELPSPPTILTSTPARRVLEVANLDVDDMLDDDVPFLDSARNAGVRPFAESEAEDAGRESKSDDSLGSSLMHGGSGAPLELVDGRSLKGALTDAGRAAGAIETSDGLGASLPKQSELEDSEQQPTKGAPSDDVLEKVAIDRSAEKESSASSEAGDARLSPEKGAETAHSGRWSEPKSNAYPKTAADTQQKMPDSTSFSTESSEEASSPRREDADLSREDPPPSSSRISAASVNISSPGTTISFPVIKPDLTNFEKLPSPTPASAHPVSRKTATSKPTSDDVAVKPPPALEKLSVQSLYRPIFSGNGAETPPMVNGAEDSDASCSTAREEEDASPSQSAASVTPNTIAGFAKTLIASEVESLLSQADTPPGSLDRLPPPPAAQAVETE